MFMDLRFPPGAMPGGGPPRPSARKMAERQEAQRRARQAQFAKLIDAFERDEIEAGVDLLIEVLDRRDGDPDLEPDDDREPDTDAEAGSIPEGWNSNFVPDDDHEEGPHDRFTRRPHRDRIRRTACIPGRKWERWGVTEWKLRNPGQAATGTARELLS